MMCSEAVLNWAPGRPWPRHRALPDEAGERAAGAGHAGHLHHHAARARPHRPQDHRQERLRGQGRPGMGFNAVVIEF